MQRIIKVWSSVSLVKKIIVGLIIGAIVGVVVPSATFVGVFGDLFVGALAGIAPILVFFLVMSAIAQHKSGAKTNMGTVIALYLIGTFMAAFLATVASFAFPVEMVLPEAVEVDTAPPSDIVGVLLTVLMKVIQNPVGAIIDSNYLGVLTWAILIGLALKKSSDGTKNLILSISEAVSQVVRWVIGFAPFGIMGLVYSSVSTSGIGIFAEYGKLLALLVGCMVVSGLVINPIIVFINIRKNPYPLVFKCLKDSFITAFFTRSSAANIPVNMTLCENLGLNKDAYSVSIPLGATINMAGAAITITVMTLATVNTLGYEVSFATALLLSVLAAISACGASGVAGGSLLLIPLACSLFGISNEIAMQVVGVGFIIGVVQDSFETGLNSSTDALFTATAEFRQRRKEGKEIKW